MGSSQSVGQVMNYCGCTDALGFDRSTRGLLHVTGIEPWNAKDLIRDKLRRQGELARRSPLRYIPVQAGLAFLLGKVNENWWSTSLSRRQFCTACEHLIRTQNVRAMPRDFDELGDVFDCMDFDKTGVLTVGEWSAGLSVFFKADNPDEAVHSIFMVLDKNHDGNLSFKELQEYFKPFVKAMSPDEAASLRPLLLKKCTQDIYKEMDLDHDDKVSSQEMIAWSRKGHNVVDKLAECIDTEVYQLWLQNQEYNRKYGWGAYTGSGKRNDGFGNQGPYGNQQGPYGSQQGPYGSQQGPYGSQQGPYGSQQGPYGSQGPFGSRSGGQFGSQQQQQQSGGFFGNLSGSQSGRFGQSSRDPNFNSASGAGYGGGCGSPQGQGQGGFGSPPRDQYGGGGAYGGAGSYGSPPPSQTNLFGQDGGYSANVPAPPPPPGRQPTYGNYAQGQGYGQPPPTSSAPYGQASGGYGQPPPAYGQGQYGGQQPQYGRGY